MTSFHPYQQSPLDYPSFDNYLTSFLSTGQTNPGDTSRYGNSLSAAGYSNPPPSAPYINSLTAAGYSGSNVVVNTSQPISAPIPSLSPDLPMPMPVPSSTRIAHQRLTGPIPHWLGDDADAERALTLDTTGDEIPDSNVIHTLGPARSSERRRRSRRMPPTPMLPPYSTCAPAPAPTAAAGPSEAVTVAEATTQPNITTAVREDVRSRARELIKGIIFTRDANASSPADQKRIIKDTINKAVRLVPSVQGLTRWPSVPKDVSAIWRAVTVVRSAMMTFARQNVVLAYDLLPPHDCDIPPDQFHVNRVHRIVRETPHAYMHDYTFAEDGTLVIRRTCQNKLIFSLLLKVIWLTNHDLYTLLATHESPREALHHAYLLACTMVECALLEQGQLTFTKHKFSVDGNQNIFDGVSSYLDSLSEAEKASLDKWKDHLIVCGKSQQGSCSTLALSEFELVIQT
ncbi:hypothetical protein EDD22DRAFT_952346 [Suillus occidentalis]|nr:hypothetical protein EDD22DRAFT_952346 [Suillus occidentalis]